MANEVLSLIKHLPKDSRVLDLGCGGLDGENTSDVLIEHFGAENVLGVCKDVPMAEKYEALHPGLRIVKKLFDPKDFTQQYDLIVNDLGIEGAMYFWENLHKIDHLMGEGTYYLTYVMCTDNYGDAETPKQIRQHWKECYFGFQPDETLIENYVNGLGYLHLVEMRREERRPEIIWVLLKRRG